MVKSNQKCLERILIYLLVELITTADKSDEDSIHISLIQKDNEALIRIRRNNFNFSHEQLKEVGELQESFGGKMEVSKKGNGISMTISLPLTFENKGLFNLPPTTTSSIKVTTGKPVRKPIRSFSKDDI